MFQGKSRYPTEPFTNPTSEIATPQPTPHRGNKMRFHNRQSTDPESLMSQIHVSGNLVRTTTVCCWEIVGFLASRTLGMLPRRFSLTSAIEGLPTIGRITGRGRPQCGRTVEFEIEMEKNAWNTWRVSTSVTDELWKEVDLVTSAVLGMPSMIARTSKPNNWLVLSQT